MDQIYDMAKAKPPLDSAYQRRNFHVGIMKYEYYKTPGDIAGSTYYIRYDPATKRCWLKIPGHYINRTKSMVWEISHGRSHGPAGWPGWMPLTKEEIFMLEL